VAPRKEAAKRRAPAQSDKSRARGERNISEQEIDDVDELSSPRSPVIYEIVRRQGDEEMERPLTSLWWSGVAGGLSISFSLLAQAILHAYLPDAPWRSLVGSFGYTAGFVIVVLARQQLFTENTITAVLPVIAEFTAYNCWRLGRMWGVVLAANMAGTFLAAVFFTYAPVLKPELNSAMLDVAGHIMHHGWGEMVSRAIVSGFLIATMVWMLPSAETAAFFVIVLMSYLVAAGGFMHIVAGSAEAFVLVLSGQLGVWPMLADFFVPVLIGNIIGGTALFAMIAYAQVMNEI